MTDDCFWSFEGCPDETTTVTPSNGGSGGGSSAGGDYGESGFDVTIAKDGVIWPVAGNLSYLTVATFITALSYMRLFRWRKAAASGETDYYALWETLNLGAFNFWSWAYFVVDWGRLGLFGLAWLFQLIATFGAATGFNRGYWLWVAILGSVLLEMYWETMMTISWTKLDASTGDAATKESLKTKFHEEWLSNMSSNALFVTLLALGYDSWTMCHVRAKEMNKVEVPYLKEVFEF